MYGERRGVYRVWWGNLREGDQLEYPGIIWEDNIKMDLCEVGWGDIDWIDLA
jgi:hypothetical protein